MYICVCIVYVCVCIVYVCALHTYVCALFTYVCVLEAPGICTYVCVCIPCVHTCICTYLGIALAISGTCSPHMSWHCCVDTLGAMTRHGLCNKENSKSE